jgi:hypothetical protein
MLLAFPALITFASCDSGKMQTYDSNAALPGATTNSLPAQSIPATGNQNAASNTQSGKVNPAHGQPGHVCGTDVGAPLNNTNPAPVSGSVPASSLFPNSAITNTATTNKQNPPHGQPGHVCGETEGASKTGSTLPVASQSAPSAGTVAATPAVTKTAPGMNPPHGQPGHRCDIAAGAPLNSKPASTTTPAANTTPKASPAPDAAKSSSALPSPLQPVSSPVQTIPDPTKAGTVKLNPAHGQPGHDCKVEVGKPLKQ